MNNETENLIKQISSNGEVSDGVKEVYETIKGIGNKADINISVTMLPFIVYLGERLDGIKGRQEVAEPELPVHANYASETEKETDV